MKKKHFHKWLAKLFEIIQEQEDKGSTSLSICWDLNKYYPQSDSGIVISPWVLSAFQRSSDVSGKKESNLLPMISSSGTIRNVMHGFIEDWP